MWRIGVRSNLAIMAGRAALCPELSLKGAATSLSAGFHLPAAGPSPARLWKAETERTANMTNLTTNPGVCRSATNLSHAHEEPARRSFLAGAAFAAAAAALAPAAALAAENGDDAALVALWREIEELDKLTQQLDAACSAAHDRFEQTKPKFPAALIWRGPTDPVSDAHHAVVAADGTRGHICNQNEIRTIAARGRPVRLWGFVGTEADKRRLGIASCSAADFPIAGIEDWFAEIPQDAPSVQRAAELVETFDAYAAAMDAAEASSGHKAAEAALESHCDKISNLIDQMLHLRPTTVEGYAAIANALVSYLWDNDMDRTSNAKPCTDERMVAHLLANLTGRPNPFATEVAAS